MKIVGIGVNKTGTTTLGKCFQKWKLKHISISNEAINLWLKKETQQIMSIIEKYDSFVDLPWWNMYKEIDKQFPKSKFILTKRINSDVWFSSYCKYAEKTGPFSVREKFYGHAMPHGNKKDYIKIYENHILDVRDYFKNRQEDLLEVCWEEATDWHMGWERLSKFLGYTIPKEPFPHENKNKI